MYYESQIFWKNPSPSLSQGSMELDWDLSWSWDWVWDWGAQKLVEDRYFPLTKSTRLFNLYFRTNNDNSSESKKFQKQLSSPSFQQRTSAIEKYPDFKIGQSVIKIFRRSSSAFDILITNRVTFEIWIVINKQMKFVSFCDYRQNQCWRIRWSKILYLAEILLLCLDPHLQDLMIWSQWKLLIATCWNICIKIQAQ